jgi:hypothetical protein
MEQVLDCSEQNQLQEIAPNFSNSITFSSSIPSPKNEIRE